MLAYIFYALFILSCVVLIVVVLLQPGKADAGALFTSSVSSTAFGPRGTQNILAKITIGAAIAFMLIALVLSLPGISGVNSVLQSETLPVSSVTPTPSPSAELTPAASPANATASPGTSPVAQSSRPAAHSSPATTPAGKPSPTAKPAATKSPK
jgi:preprotein translocase subunit SecG